MNNWFGWHKQETVGLGGKSYFEFPVALEKKWFPNIY